MGLNQPSVILSKQQSKVMTVTQNISHQACWVGIETVSDFTNRRATKDFLCFLVAFTTMLSVVSVVE